jgi:CheY-like chemotaxis protein
MAEQEPEKLILLVDDDKDFLFSLKCCLETLGYEVKDVTNAKEAFDRIKNETPDLVISDIEMPGESGIDLLKKIRKHSPHIPVIIVTGKPAVEAVVQCLRCGADDFLAKPVNLEEMKKKIEDVFKAPLKHKSIKTIQRDDQGRILGGYKINSTLGEGNFGVVFLVEKVENNRKNKYALKILKPGDWSEEVKRTYVKRFEKEAEAMSQIKHLNVVEIIEHGATEEEMIPFIVMEYLTGKSLRFYLGEERQFTYRQKAEIILQVAEGLAAVHAINICHRDIKPENIVVDEMKQVKITDFGIARLPDSDLTMTSNVMGTPNYLSPEGFVTAKVDHRSDVFSLGVVAYEFFHAR